MPSEYLVFCFRVIPSINLIILFSLFLTLFEIMTWVPLRQKGSETAARLRLQASSRSLVGTPCGLDSAILIHG